jgi:hypothetical protein
MYTSISFNPSINVVLDYHQEKINRKVAECIAAENFIMEKEKLSYADKAYPFELRASYNETVKKKVLHTSMQFAVGEKIADATLAEIGMEYHRGMGRGEQPCIIYRHSDVDKLHIHLVSPNIDREGKRIGVSKYDLARSQELTEHLAKKYGLQARYPEMGDSLQEAVEKMQAGSAYLYPAMNRILEEVIPRYRYTNLAELNAVLRLYKIEASRGKEDTLTYKRMGLHYHLLQTDGQLSTEYFPARQFRMRPTLHYLEKRFAENKLDREQHRKSLAVTVDYALAGKQLSLGELQQALARRKVRLITREDKGAGIQAWFIDHQNNTVFEGEALGLQYSFAGLQKRLIPEEANKQRVTQQQNQRQNHHHRHSL